MSSSGAQTSSRPPAKPKSLEAHRLQGAVAGEDHQVGPGELPAVLLLDRPEQPPRLVEAHVVGPTVERRETERAGGAAAAAVADPVRAGRMPRHPDEERSVVAVIRRPPVLGGRHYLLDVLLQLVQVDLREFLGVVEVLAHRIGEGRVLVERPEVQLVRPPALIRDGPHRRMSVGSCQDRALRFARHIVHRGSLPSRSLSLAKTCVYTDPEALKSPFGSGSLGRAFLSGNRISK